MTRETYDMSAFGIEQFSNDGLAITDANGLDILHATWRDEDYEPISLDKPIVLREDVFNERVKAMRLMVTAPKLLEAMEIAADILNGIDGNDQVDIAQQYLADAIELATKGAPQ